MGNIFIAPDDESRIVSLVDFQALSVLPIFLQPRRPAFLKPPENYIKGLVQSKLPDGFNEFDEKSKSIALREWAPAKASKVYEISTYLEDSGAQSDEPAACLLRALRLLRRDLPSWNYTTTRMLNTDLLEVVRGWDLLEAARIQLPKRKAIFMNNSLLYIKSRMKSNSCPGMS
ncbi:hypothetical protein BBP40_011321 [Aspergillus hancockii]|nr:hypothetical protein BBP40_011321 [Aspergillus hancockii]